MRALLVLLVLAFPSALGASDAYLKGGFYLHVDGEDVDEIDVNDRWWVGGGADWHFASTGLVGFEVSGAYHADVIGGKVTSRVVPIDVLLDVRFKPGTGDVRPYVGGGAGLASALVWTDVAVAGFASSFAWERAFAYQAFGGVEVHRRWLVEAVFQRTYATAASVQANPVGPDHAFSVAAGVTW
jgi:hypothetical protein